MAFTVYSTAAGAFDNVSTTISLPPVGLGGARNRMAKGVIALATADFDTVGDQIALCVLPTIARVHSIGIQSDNLGTTVTANIGLYDTDSARTVIDADAYASAVSIDALSAPTGTTSRNEFRWESATTDLNTIEQRVWEDGGVTSYPAKQWLLALTITVISSAVAGDLGFFVEYTID